MSRFSWAALITVVLAGTMVVAQTNEPSLGDVARQKSVAKAKRVVTNEEIPPSPEADKPPESAKAISKTPAANDDDQKAKPATDPQARLVELTKDNQDLQKVVTQVQSKNEASEDPEIKKTLAETLQHVKTLMEQNNAEIAKLKEAGFTLPPEKKSTEGTPAETTAAPAPTK